ncbi:14599_t:CDS:2 [Entrophospora sp. SA101]|nr:14599_t:CDS:2 [Entrophospora sp. SA101]CAJ0917011.1 173_t:CDS:2 [Entrophospora sp. SA101]
MRENLLSGALLQSQKPPELLVSFPRNLSIFPPTPELRELIPISPTVLQNAFTRSLSQSSLVPVPIIQVPVPINTPAVGFMKLAPIAAPALNVNRLHLETLESIVSFTPTSPPLS